MGRVPYCVELGRVVSGCGMLCDFGADLFVVCAVLVQILYSVSVFNVLANLTPAGALRTPGDAPLLLNTSAAATTATTARVWQPYWVPGLCRAADTRCMNRLSLHYIMERCAGAGLEGKMWR